MRRVRLTKLTRAILSILALSLCLAGYLAGPAASAEEKSWDQAHVTDVADRLASQVKAMRAAARKEPQAISAGTPTKQRTAALFLETLKKLERATAKLARQLASHETRQQTLGIARRVDSLLRDAVNQGANLNSTQWTSQFSDPALVLAAELRRLYSETETSDAVESDSDKAD